MPDARDAPMPMAIHASLRFVRGSSKHMKQYPAEPETATQDSD